MSIISDANKAKAENLSTVKACTMIIETCLNIINEIAEASGTKEFTDHDEEDALFEEIKLQKKSVIDWIMEQVEVNWIHFIVNKPQTERTENMEELLKEIKENDHELYLVVVKIYKGYGIEIEAE